MVHFYIVERAHLKLIHDKIIIKDHIFSTILKIAICPLKVPLPRTFNELVKCKMLGQRMVITHLDVRHIQFADFWLHKHIFYVY